MTDARMENRRARRSIGLLACSMSAVDDERSYKDAAHQSADRPERSFAQRDRCVRNGHLTGLSRISNAECPFSLPRTHTSDPEQNLGVAL